VAGHRIFISYRRNDSDADAGRLFDGLASRFGKDALFKDVDHVPLGANVAVAIADAIERSGVLVAVVGPNWVTDRLRSERDWVRVEIETALELGVPILPVRVRRAQMPQPSEVPASIVDFCGLNAAEVEHQSWRRDIEPVVSAVEQILAGQARTIQFGDYVVRGRAPSDIDEMKKLLGSTVEAGLQSTEAHVRIWDTFLSDAASQENLATIMTAHQGHGSVRILLVSPLTEFASMRAEELDSTPEELLRDGLAHIWEAADDREMPTNFGDYLEALGQNLPDFDIRFTNARAKGPIFRIGDLVLHGVHHPETPSTFGPWDRDVAGTPEFDEQKRIFAKYWKKGLQPDRQPKLNKELDRILAGRTGGSKDDPGSQPRVSPEQRHLMARVGLFAAFFATLAGGLVGSFFPRALAGLAIAVASCFDGDRGFVSPIRRKLLLGGLAVVAVLIAYGISRSPTREDGPPDGVAGLVGGCEKFPLFAQNRWDPLGASGRAEPSATGGKVRSFAPNEIVVVDGWVRSRAPYPANSPPWNSDVWFHLADDSGWVSFAGVRADPTTPDETGGFSPDGGRAAPLDEACSGSID